MLTLARPWYQEAQLIHTLFLGDAAIAAGIQGIAPGSPAGFVPPPPQIIIDGSKSTRVLGLNYRSKAETTVHAIKSYYELFPAIDPSKSRN